MKHKHCEVIKAKADGSTVQENIPPYSTWNDMGDEDWCFYSGHNYRIKPPAPKWPETNLSPDFLNDAWLNFNGPPYEACTHIANLALCYALETGQVVLPDAERNARIAVVERIGALYGIDKDQLEKQIASIK